MCDIWCACVDAPVWLVAFLSTCLPPASKKALARYESSVCCVSLRETDVYSNTRCALTFTLCCFVTSRWEWCVCVCVWICGPQVMDVNIISKDRGRQRKICFLSLFPYVCFFANQLTYMHTNISMLFLFPVEEVDTKSSITVNRAWDRWNVQKHEGRWGLQGHIIEVWGLWH